MLSYLKLQDFLWTWPRALMFGINYRVAHKNCSIAVKNGLRLAR